MKKSDLVTILTAAFTTATLTVGFFWSTPLEAGGEGAQLTPAIAKPKLVTKGLEMTLSVVSGDKAGAAPIFELAAVNISGKPAEVKVHLAMTASTPTSALSRTVSIPANLWQCDQSIVLKAGENKTFTLATGTTLPAGNLLSVVLSEVAPGQPADAQPTLALRNGAPAAVAVLTFSTAPSAVLVAGPQQIKRSSAL